MRIEVTVGGRTPSRIGVLVFEIVSWILPFYGYWSRWIAVRWMWNCSKTHLYTKDSKKSKHKGSKFNFLDWAG